MRKTKKILSILLAVLCAVSLISCQKSTQSSNMKIHYIDVGQGDCELIQIEDKNILIDAGTSDKKALDYLKSA